MLIAQHLWRRSDFVAAETKPRCFEIHFNLELFTKKSAYWAVKFRKKIF